MQTPAPVDFRGVSPAAIVRDKAFKHLEDWEARAVMRAMAQRELPQYSATFLRILNFKGKTVPFIMNEAQQRTHRLLQKQLAETGRVRALILKARQLGMSTYVNARFYSHTTTFEGIRTFILTHEQPATKELFGRVDFMHEQFEPALAAKLKTRNVRELEFAYPLGGYRVGTAGTKERGRSQTIQRFHGSEVAMWPNAEMHLAGVMQAVSDERGTEIILESTARGVGGVFHKMWQQAVRSESEYIPIFLPWYWEPRYRKDPKHNPPFIVSPEEAEYADLHGLDDWQLCWLHFKNIGLGGEPGTICDLFRQEYPATADEAFRTTGVDSLIKGSDVLRARRTDFTLESQAMFAHILGVDLSWGGDDRTRMIDRRGRKLGGTVNKVMNTADTNHLTGTIARLIDEHKFDQTFIDVGGVGHAIVNRLDELGYGSRVAGVNFGSMAIENTKYFNKRAEMWCPLDDWLRDPGGADIPDDDGLHADFCAPGLKYASEKRKKLEPKEDIRSRVGFSPDGGDAACLTFAEPVAKADPERLARRRARHRRSWKSR